MNDKTLKCRDCGASFVFTANEQAFYQEKGFENEPQRCPSCRAAKKQQSRGGRGDYSNAPRQMYEATCAGCGVETTVPFKPTSDRPVYCKECYQKQSR